MAARSAEVCLSRVTSTVELSAKVLCGLRPIAGRGDGLLMVDLSWLQR